MIRRGTMIGDNYVVKELLGGGSGDGVYLAGREGEGAMLYTLKVSKKKDILKREAMLLGEINSRYFPRFVDYIEDVEYGYLLLEYVEGTTLQALMDQGRVFSEQEAMIIAESVTDALSLLHYHRTPMLHLDIKPANIMVTTKGEIRIIDLGAGCMVGEKLISKGGTYGYGAPEQFWQGVLPGPEADVYACGKLMSYLFTGKNPGIPPYEVDEKMLKSYGVRKEIRQVIMKCLEIEQTKRYPDCGVIRKVIRELQEKRLSGGGPLGKKEPEIIYRKCIWKSDYERV